ncbi:MAG: sigma-70 family RNA polymerase sigma factor, partial [Aeromicrobium sp.]
EIESLRSQVVTINMRIAESLARRYYGHGENDEDLKQVAYLALTKAARGFHADLGHNFLSYAVPTITGELKKHFRDRCWTVRPPRRVQDLQREITALRQSMSQEIHRQPALDELAHELGVPVVEVAEAAAAQGCFSPRSLDVQIKSDSTTTLADLIPGDDRDLSRAEAHLLLAPVISSLTEADREILTLRFFEEWTQEQIARKLGTSQMQISRHLSRIMKRLRTALEPAADCA